MTGHRTDYWITIIASAIIAFTGILALSLLVVEGLAARAPWPPLGWGLWLVGCLVLLGGETLAILVLMGGFISLHRDKLESRGLPYASRRPLEWRAGSTVSGIRAAVRALHVSKGQRTGRLSLRPGELVEVRRIEEILETLDEQGMRDSLPFMPEMVAWCSRQTRVLRRADKVFDWILGTGMHRMRDTVFLEGSRCPGSAHGGCQADCQMLWKEIWLKRASKRDSPTALASKPHVNLDCFTHRIDAKTAEPRFVCQLTQLPRTTTQLSWNDPRHYLRDLMRGNVRMSPFLTGISIYLFNVAQRRCGRARFPIRGSGKSLNSPHAVLDLQPGELVRVKSKRAIEATLDVGFRNRGLWFDAEMMRFCGSKHTVLTRVNRQIEEKSGKMITFKNPCIVLEDVTATGEYMAFALLNERIYWREIWLERVPSEESDTSPIPPISRSGS